MHDFIIYIAFTDLLRRHLDATYEIASTSLNVRVYLLRNNNHFL